jgi:CHAT domain-containing protein
MLNNIGQASFLLRDEQKALDHYALALTIFRLLGDRAGEATTLGNIGGVNVQRGELQKAFEIYGQALMIRRALGDRRGEALALSQMARIDLERGNLLEARKQIESSLSTIESLRTKIVRKDLQASYFATTQGYYEFYVDLLMRLHKQRILEGLDAAAMQASERARARGLLDLLAEAQADIRQGADLRLVERERSLQQQLNARAQQQLQLLNGSHSDEQAQTIAKEIESLTTELQQVEARIRQTSPRYAALTQPQPLTLKEIQTQVLDEDTLLLEYSLGKERSYLWAVMPTSITSFELPKRDEIEAVARQVYAQLSADKKWETKTSAGQRELTREKAETRSGPGAASRLSQMLLGPVAAQLGNKRLLIVADGALQYIPFAALPLPIGSGPSGTGEITRKGKSTTDKYQPLVVEHEIVSLPSASTLAVLRKEVKDRKPAQKTVAILADPVFESDDERVRQALKTPAGAPPNDPPVAKTRELPPGLSRAATESGLEGTQLRIPRLPATRDEARQILALFPPAQSKGSFDFDASRKTAMSGELSQYRYVHFATHGFLDSLHPELSGLVLSMVDEKGNPQDGFLRAHEIFNLKLSAELVVLSACQTGLGKEVKGEGLVSLTRGFMYAGAPRVVVSLWSVNDEATAELMARFYRGMLRDKLRPAAALRAAQISLMEERRWESPFYWAAFTIQGEWR